jgi:adenylyltransferase/sulfurtransferase
MKKPDYFDRQNNVLAPETGERIKNTSILVVGVGAGGNELLKNLILMGFGHFTIVDFDFIEDSNLSRTTLFRKSDIGKSKAMVAAKRLAELSLHEQPCITGIHGNIMTDVGQGIFLRHDIVMCCVDTLKARAYINDWCVRLKKPFFEMGFDHMNVDVSFFNPSIDNAPCLREIIGQGVYAENRSSCSGLKIKDVQFSHIPTIQVASAMAGVLVAMEVIKFIQGVSSIENKILQYYGLQQRISIFGVDRSLHCQLHHEPPFNFTKVSCSSNCTVIDFLNFINSEFHNYFILTLPERYVLYGNCEGCGKTIDYNSKFESLYDEQRWCLACRPKAKSNFSGNWQIVSELHLKMKDNDLLHKKLSALGVPPMAFLPVIGIANDSVKYFNILLD